jgi:hypothetical protein
MILVVFYKLNRTTLSPTLMRLQPVDQSVHYPVGITKDIPVKVRGLCGARHGGGQEDSAHPRGTIP